MSLTELTERRNTAPAKSSEIDKEDIAAFLIAARFMLTIERARLIVLLAGLSNEEAAR